MRVPAIDWPALTVGTKRQLRVRSERAPTTNVEPLPTPIVGYVTDTALSNGYRAAAMLVLEAIRVEPLLAISPADLEAEGFTSMDEYRKYWNAHRDGGFRPLAKVAVLSLRPFEPDDLDELGRAVLGHLYGPWLDGVRSQ